MWALVFADIASTRAHTRFLRTATRCSTTRTRPGPQSGAGRWSGCPRARPTSRDWRRWSRRNAPEDLQALLGSVGAAGGHLAAWAECVDGAQLLAGRDRRVVEPVGDRNAPRRPNRSAAGRPLRPLGPAGSLGTADVALDVGAGERVVLDVLAGDAAVLDLLAADLARGDRAAGGGQEDGDAREDESWRWASHRAKLDPIWLPRAPLEGWEAPHLSERASRLVGQVPQ